MAFIIDDLLLLPFNLAKKVLEGIINEVDKERLVTKEGVMEKLKEYQLLLDEGKISEVYVKVPIIMPSLLVPVAPPGPSRFRYHLGLDLVDPACLVPELDLLHLINSNWAAQRAIRLRYLLWATRACRILGTTVGYPEIIPTTVAPGVPQDLELVIPIPSSSSRHVGTS